MLKIISKLFHLPYTTKRKEDSSMITSVVSSDNQSNGGKILKFIDLYKENSPYSLPAHYLPKIEILDEAVFMVPTKHVISANDDYYIKYLVLDENQVPIHGHDYPYVRLPSEGFILKINSHYNDAKIQEFSISYLLNINDVKLIPTTELQAVTTADNEPDIEGILTYDFYPISTSEYTRSLEMLLADRKLFFDKYISDVLN